MPAGLTPRPYDGCDGIVLCPSDVAAAEDASVAKPLKFGLFHGRECGHGI
jgi:hypothetical protein